MKSIKTIILKSPIPQSVLLFGFLGFIFSITYLNRLQIGLIFLLIEIAGVFLVAIEMQREKKSFFLLMLSIVVILSILAGYFFFFSPPEIVRLN